MLFGIRFRHAGMIVLVVVLALSYTMVLNAPGYAQTYNWTRNEPGSGFGDTNNVTIYSMAVYGGKLYAGTENNVSGTEIWSYDGSAWTQANVDGFGDANNNRSYSMAVFSGKLYVGVWNASTGAQVWSYDGSTWSQANVSGFGNPSNGGVFSLAVHGGSLYAGTGASVADVYAYDGSNWTQVSSGGFGDAGNTYCYCLADYNGSLYAGTMNYTSGIQVYRYDAPGWTQVNVSGFGDGANNLCHSMAEYGGRLYVGTANFATGTEVWSYDGSTWTQVNSDGYGSAANVTSRSMVVYRGRLYLGTQNDTAGGGVWDYDGSTWTQANNAGFGDTNNKRCYGLAAYNDHLYVGTKNSAGTQVWRNNAPVLEVIKSAVPTQVNAGGTIDYSIALTNSGDADATGVLLTDQIPQYTSVVAGSCTCSDPGATINSENPVDVSGITVGQSATVTVDFSVTVDADVPDATLISNQAFIRGDGVTTPSSDPQHPGLGQPTLVLARRAAPVKPAGSKTWYLAEGSTGSDNRGSFESWVLVQNAGNVAAGVDLYYQTPTGEVAGPHLNLAPHTRQTVNVAETVPGQWSVSTRVVSNNPVIAERAMYWNSGDGVYRQAATDSIGVTTPGTTWYLAEGSTGSDNRGSFESWVLVQNAGNVAAGVDLYYQTPTGEVAGPHLNIAAHTRQTVNVAETVPNQWSVSTRLVSNNPVIAERAMYWNSGEGVYRQAATDSIGVITPGTTWYLAEGSTGSDESGSFESWVLVQNAGNVAAGVDLYYQTPTGEVAGPHLNLAPHTRQTVNVAETVPGQWSVSTRVVSNNPVIAERAMYWNSGDGVYRQAATDSIGVTTPGTTWYLAEGSTGSDNRGSFESWVLVQNAGNVAAGVDLYYQTPTGEVAGPHLNIAAHTRQTVNVAETVPNQWSVSTRVVSNNPVIAERAMYWNSGEGVYRQAATDSIGVDP